MKFRKLYFQKMSTTDKQGQVTDYPMMESIADFHLYCSAFPYVGTTESKNLPTNDWPDEDGEEVFVPSVIPIRAFDMELKLHCKANSIDVANARTQLFRKYITGRDGTGSRLMIFSEQTNLGRQGLIFKKMDPPELIRTKSRCVVSYKVTFRVTDPVTELEIKNYRLVPITEQNG